MVARTKKAADLDLRDVLSRLSPEEAERLLGERGSRLLQQGGKWDVDLDEQVVLTGRRFVVDLFEAEAYIELDPAARRRLRFSCTACDTVCEHIGAAFSVVLEDKMALGLAAPPTERTPVEALGEEELERVALEERLERARTERMRLQSLEPDVPWTDYTITNTESGKTYRLALRGVERGDSYCSCPDFRKNTLGTCKHILHALRKVKRKFSADDLRVPYRQREIAVHLQYGFEIELRVLLPQIRTPEIRKLVEPLRDRPITDVPGLLRRVRRLEAAGRSVTIYPDAEEYIQARLFERRLAALVEEVRRDPASHPLRESLLRVELLPYQLDGIAFAAGAGRAILADDMGLGKTIQGIGVAELLAREAGVRKVLVVCPATLKAQWRAEIQRFSKRDCQLVLGPAAKRRDQYRSGSFFTVCNYEQVLRDVDAVENAHWDLIVLDEGQRIKNWEAKTTRTIKALRSRFALVLTGTPLENRLDDLYSIVEFVDDRRLGPAFRFYNHHRLVDDKGKVLGYRNLDELRASLAPVLLRRTRSSVMRELPPRTTEIVRITPTAEQIELHRGWMQIVRMILGKKYISEMDLLRLRKALLMCRMVANSTFLIDKKTHYSTKTEKLDELFAAFCDEGDRKVVLFSEWTTMLGIVEEVLAKHDLGYVRLDGSIPQKDRQQLVHRFQHDPDCAVFVTTNAGATGLNLQAANTVVNVDLPWNPAVLEQRIARAHRMGQKQPVQVFVLVTEDTLEENLLGTLSAKHELSLAVLDFESDVDEVALQSGMEELKRRLEVLLGAKPAAPIDESEKARQSEEAARLAQRERVEVAGGQLLSSAFSFLSEMLPDVPPTESTGRLSESLKARLEDCMSEDDKGRPQLKVTLPDRAALATLASSLARLVGGAIVEPRQADGGTRESRSG